LTQKIAFSAVLAAICVVIKSVSITTFTLKISFSYIPNFMAGIFLGPYYGFVVGVSGDLIGTIIQGQSPLVLFSLGNALMGFCMGMVFHYSYIKNAYFKIIGGAFAVLVTVTYGINTLAFTAPAPLGTGMYADYFIALSARIPQGLILVINTVIVLGLYTAVEKAYFSKFRRRKKQKNQQ
jgi:ECF transporter S component (folate family)